MVLLAVEEGRGDSSTEGGRPGTIQITTSPTNLGEYIEVPEPQLQCAESVQTGPELGGVADRIPHGVHACAVWPRHPTGGTAEGISPSCLTDSGSSPGDPITSNTGRRGMGKGKGRRVLELRPRLSASRLSGRREEQAILLRVWPARRNEASLPQLQRVVEGGNPGVLEGEPGD